MSRVPQPNRESWKTKPGNGPPGGPLDRFETMHKQPSLYETLTGRPRDQSPRGRLRRAALGITVLTGFWFVACWSATEAAWWNAEWLFIMALSAALALVAASFFAAGPPAT